METSRLNEIIGLLPREWIFAGYGGEHEEAGAHIVDGHGNHIVSTGHVLGGMGSRNWAAYFALADAVINLPTLLRELARLRRWRETAVAMLDPERISMIDRHTGE